MNPPSLHILIAEPFPVISEGVEAMITKAGIAKKVHAAKTAGEAVMLAQSFKADVVVVDEKVPDLPPEHCIVKLKQQVPAAALLMVTESLPAKRAVALNRCGCSGFLHTSFTADDLLTAIYKTLGGEQYYSAQFANDVVNHTLKKLKQATTPLPFDISNTQKQLIYMVCAGNTNREMANKLHISEKAIEKRLHNLFVKTETKNKQQLIVFALRKGIVVDGEI